MRNHSFFRIFVSLFFLTLLTFSLRGETGEMVQALKKTHPLYFFIGFLLQIIITGLISTRLKLIFNAQGLPLRLREAIELSFLGIFFNNFLPTAIGGDLPKAYYAYKKTRKKMESFICVLGDRFVGLFSLICLAFVGVFLLWKELAPSIKISVMVLFLLASFAISLFFSRRMSRVLRFLLGPLRKIGWEKKTEQLHTFFHIMSRKKKLLVQALMISFGCHLLFVSSVFILIQGLSATISFVRLFVVLPLIVAVSMLPSLNGLGIREGAFVFFLGGSLGKGSALALAVLFLVFLALQSIIGGIYYLAQGWRKVPLEEIRKIQ